MSSHHIVRDFQEPSLLIADGEACGLGLLESLLEWSPVVVVLDSALPRVLSLGIKVDYVLGDFDDFDPELLLKKSGQDHIEIIRAEDQNKTDLQKGIEFLIEKGASGINIVWADGRRMDHTLGNVNTLASYASRVQLVMWNDYSRLYGLPMNFSKWFQKGAKISLLPFPSAGGFMSKNLKYPLEGHEFNIGGRVGTSNEAAEDGIVEISYEKGLLLMVEAWDKRLIT